jgi:hypothetical protein
MLGGNLACGLNLLFNSSAINGSVSRVIIFSRDLALGVAGKDNSLFFSRF